MPASGQTVARTGTARGWAPTREASEPAPLVEAEVAEEEPIEETVEAPPARPVSKAKPRAGTVRREAPAAEAGVRAANHQRPQTATRQAQKPQQRGELQTFDPWVSQTAGASRPPQKMAARSRQVAPGGSSFVENGRVIHDGDVIYEGDPNLMPESLKARRSAPASRGTSYSAHSTSSRSNCKSCNGGGGGHGEYVEEGGYEGGDCESCGSCGQSGGCGQSCSSCGDGNCCDKRMGLFGICRDFGCDDCGPWIDEDDCDNCRRWWRRRDCGCEDWRLVDNLTLFGGFHGFTSAPDMGVNGNFGLGYGVNFGAPLWPRFGIGYQIGYRGITSNFNGELVSGNVGQTRQQHFMTVGAFRRFSCDNLGYWQWGVAADFLEDRYYDEYSLSQTRVEVSHYLDQNIAIGFLGSFRSQGDTGTLAGATVNWQGIDQYQLFVRGHFCNGGECRISGGATDGSDGLFGMEATVPFNDSWALHANGLALFPTEGPSVAGTMNEAWNVSMNLVWFPGGTAVSKARSVYRPLFNVADNGSFLLDVAP